MARGVRDKDRLSKLKGKEAEADESTRKVEESEMHLSQPLVADSQPAKAIHPGEGPLDYPAIPPECLAGLDPATGDAATDTALAQVVPTAWEVVALVRMQLGWPLTWSAKWSLDRFDRFDQVFEEDRVVDVGCREPDREWDALAVDQEVPLRPRFATVGRVRANFLVRTAPLFAGTLEASRLARDQSILSACPS
jgi:hypothetical protein